MAVKHLSGIIVRFDLHILLILLTGSHQLLILMNLEGVSTQIIQTIEVSIHNNKNPQY